MAKQRLRFIKPVYMLTGGKDDRQKRKVLAAIGSIRQDEFFLAMREGLSPKLMIIVHNCDYKDEELIEIDGVVLSVYRVFPNLEKGVTEIYLLKKKGNQ